LILLSLIFTAVTVRRLDVKWPLVSQKNIFNSVLRLPALQFLYDFPAFTSDYDFTEVCGKVRYLEVATSFRLTTWRNANSLCNKC